VEVELARLDGEATEARRSLTERGQSRPRANGGAGGEARPPRAQAEQLGGVNPSRGGVRAEKEHLSELRTQRADLEQSLPSWTTWRRELSETVERRFAETYAAVERNFAEVAGRSSRAARVACG